jgi:hypothetical protein
MRLENAGRERIETPERRYGEQQRYDARQDADRR